MAALSEVKSPKALPISIPLGLDGSFPIEPFRIALTEIVRHWQRVLRLEDWNILVEVARAVTLGPDTLSDITANVNRRDAVMRLLHPWDLSLVASIFPMGDAQDYELSIIHELIHLHLPMDSPDGSPAGVALEQAINVLSRALIGLDREPQPRTLPVHLDKALGIDFHGDAPKGKK